MLEEQLQKGEALKTTAGRRYLDFLDILLTSKVGSYTDLMITYNVLYTVYNTHHTNTYAYKQLIHYTCIQLYTYMHYTHACVCIHSPHTYTCSYAPAMYAAVHIPACTQTHMYTYDIACMHARTHIQAQYHNVGNFMAFKLQWLIKNF